MTPVKIQEIQAVREVLAAQSDRESLEQCMFVANWINSFSNEKSRLLEIGCGNGSLSEFVIAKYAGIDPIERDDLPEGLDFKMGVGECIPHPDKSFDYILVKDAINYFSDLEPLLDEALRVLAEDGAILVTEYVGPKYRPATQKLKNTIKKYLRVRSNIWDSTYFNYYTSHDVIKAASRRGLVAEYEYRKNESRYYLIIRKRGAVERQA